MGENDQKEKNQEEAVPMSQDWPQAVPPASPLPTFGRASGEEPSRPAELSRLTQALEEKEAEIIALVDRLKRTAAEFDNYKKRAAKDKEEFRKFALEGLILEILPVIDNLERAISHGEEPAPASGLLEGVRITLSQLVKSLEKFGVTSFDSKGAAFDPERHEAMEVVESSLFTPDTIIEEHRKGYLLNGRVIRPALVTVCKASSEPPIIEEKLQGNVGPGETNTGQ